MPLQAWLITAEMATDKRAHTSLKLHYSQSIKSWGLKTCHWRSPVFQSMGLASSKNWRCGNLHVTKGNPTYCTSHSKTSQSLRLWRGLLFLCILHSQWTDYSLPLTPHHLCPECHLPLQVWKVWEVAVIFKHGGHMNAVNHSHAKRCEGTKEDTSVIISRV